MKIKLKLKSSPISTNSAYYKRNKAFNENSRKWRATFFAELMKDSNMVQMEKFKAAFDQKKHMLRVCFTWFQPLDVLITKSGHISLRSMDVDNTLKIPTDCVFDSKYNQKWLSIRSGGEKKLYKDFSTLKNLDINDKFIVDTRSIKLPSDDGDFHCVIDIEILDLFPHLKLKK